MLLKRRKPPKMGTRQEAQIRSPGHLQFVRGYQCCAAKKHTCWGRSEAHHVKSFMDGAMGRKPGDDKAIPCCSLLHREIHDCGEEATARKYGLNFEIIAADLWAQSPAGKKYRREQDMRGQ